MMARSEARGVTLVELVVALAVSTLVIAAGVALLLSQQRAFRSGSGDRAMQETARLALGELTARLSMAGYGIDPALAFDFGELNNVRIDRAPPGALVKVTGYLCSNPVVCRDNPDSSDEVVFLSRDPAFNHLTADVPSRSALTIAGPLNAPLRPGQILQLTCLGGVGGGGLSWAFVTVAREVPADTAARVTVPLKDGAGTDFPLQNDWLVDARNPCFQRAGHVSVLKVDRYRYFIGTYDALGRDTGWNGPGGRPFLMLDQGLLDAAGEPIVTPVAADIEDLQITYLFPAALAPARTAVPLAPNRLVDGAGGIDRAPAAGAPGYTSLRGDPTRATNYPANIRGVRVAISVRSPEASAIFVNATENLIPAAGNRDAVPARDAGYRHMLFDATVIPHNLDARTPHVPVVTQDPNANVDHLNVGGG